MVEIIPNRDDVLDMVVRKATERVESQYYLLRRSSIKAFLAACAFFLVLLGFSGWAAVRATMQSALAEALKTSGAQSAINELEAYRDDGKAAADELQRLVADAQRPGAVGFHVYLGEYDFPQSEKHQMTFDLDAASDWPHGNWNGGSVYVVPEDGVYALIANFNRDPAGDLESTDVYIRVWCDKKELLVAWAGYGEVRKPGVGHSVVELKKGQEIMVYAEWGTPETWSQNTRHLVRELTISAWKIGDIAERVDDPVGE